MVVRRPLAVDLCRPHPANPRKKLPPKVTLLALGQSLMVKQINPIRVNPIENGFHYIVAGVCRVESAKLVGLTHLEADILDVALTPAQIRIDQLTDNLARHDIQAIEKAEAFSETMHADGLNAQQLADQVGVSAGMVSKLLALIDLLPDELKELNRCGHLPFSHAYQLTRLTNLARMQELALQCVKSADKPLTKEALTAIIDRELKGTAKRKEKPVTLAREFPAGSSYDVLRQFANWVLSKVTQLEKAGVAASDGIPMICKGV